MEKSNPSGTEGTDSEDSAGAKPISSTGFVAPTVEELKELIPGYEFLEFIDRGGMGAVYRAEQLELRRSVAVKLLAPDFGKELGFEARFRREARTMAQLSHPNIVSVHDFGETREGHLYIVMEYIEGSDLRHMIRNGELKPTDILPIINQICDALQYAHDHGVIHRDIKPANIFVNKQGQVKIGDFGLAKPRETGADRSQVSHPGVSIGTPAYMAPEAIEDVELDHRADIYSIGVVIYEMLTGSVPKGAWDPPSKCSGADRKFDEVVNRAMQSNRDERFQQASEISHAFDRESSAARQHRQAQASSEMPSQPSSLLIGLTILALVAVIALVFSSIHREPRRLVSKEPELQPLSTVEFERTSRELASWVFDKGGFVQIRNADHNVISVSDLPKGIFEIWRISFEHQTEFSDTDVKQLVDYCYLLPAITNLNLQSTAITPAGALELTRLSERLKGLNLADTRAVSNDSIDHLAGFQELNLLVLSVFDQPDPEEFPPMSDDGVRELNERLPNCTIAWRTSL